MSDTEALIDRILLAAEAFPKEIARNVIRALLTEKPAEFVKVGSHTRPDGQKFNVLAYGAPEVPKAPHNAGTPLKAEEITSVLTQWNAEAKQTIEGMKP